MLVDEVVDLGRHLDPCGTPTDDHKGQLGLGHFVPDQGDFFEALYDTVSDAFGVFDPPHGQAVFLDTGDAEKVRLSAKRDYELIIGELETACGLDDLAVRVYTRDPGPPEACAGEDEGAPQGLCDVAGVDVAADDPWHHRPEGEEVVARYEKDPDVIAALCQLAHVGSRRVPSEPPAEDHDLLLELAVGGPLPGGVAGRRVER